METQNPNKLTNKNVFNLVNDTSRKIIFNFKKWGQATKNSAIIRIFNYLFLFLICILAAYFTIFTITPVVNTTMFKLSLKEFRPDLSYFSGKQPADNYLKKVQREITVLENRLRRLLPRDNYLVINTTENRIYLFSGNKIIHEGICSTGSYVKLKAGNDRQWIFQTPKGMFTIHGKAVSPVWRKPDWAFIEEGLPVPPKDSQLRFEAGVLGDYALSLGGGYLIHGTLYQRFLGLPVTHGCIRLGDYDLEKVYHALELGARVYIY